MNEQFFQNIGNENDIKNIINFYGFDNILSYIIIIINKICTVLKIGINRRKKSYELLFFYLGKSKNIYFFFKICYFKIITRSAIILMVKKTKNIKNNKIKKNQIKKRANNNHAIIKKYLIIILIILLIINIFCQKKSTILYNLFHFYYSSKITLKIKGIGESDILGNEKDAKFEGNNFLEKVYINGKEQKLIKYKYDFSQIDNDVELIWDDKIDDYGYMFWKCLNITEINLTDFHPEPVLLMNHMFGYCSSLT